MRKSYDKPLIRIMFCPNVDVLTASALSDDCEKFNLSWIGVAKE